MACGVWTVAALGVLVMVTFGARTLMVAVAVRVAGLLFVEVTEAIFVSVPLKPAAVVPLTTNVTVAPGASVPRMSLTVLVPLSRVARGVPVGPAVLTAVQLTPVGVGSASLTLTP